MPNYDPNRPWRHLYGRLWRRLSKAFLVRNPLCAMCSVQCAVTPATIVDHKTPHKGDPKLFWSQSNWQGLCEYHHNSTKQAIEKGQTLAHDMQGYPQEW